MADIVNSRRRSEMMSGIKGRDTAPEIVVRRTAHRLGFRFRLYRKDLPGRPSFQNTGLWYSCMVASGTNTRSANMPTLPRPEWGSGPENSARTLPGDRRNGVPELKRAMGLSDDYKLQTGTRRDRIRLLGNGVCPPVMEAVVRSLIWRAATNG